MIAEGKAAARTKRSALEKEVKQVEDDLHAALVDHPEHDAPGRPGRQRRRPTTRSSRRGASRAEFDFKPKDHVALAEALDLVDFEAGAAVAGQKFYFLKNEAVLLELALVQYAMQTLVADGYTPVITPDLARVEVLEGIGFMPRDPDPETRQIYTIADTDLCLIATAEITLGGMHRDKIFDEADLPKKYVGLSHCFRTEAGAPGRDTRGLYRVHQFTKVEMFAFCTPDQSEAIHQEMLAHRGEASSRAWGCRTTSSTPAPATWAARPIASTTWRRGCPAAAQDGGEYGEVTSTSNCTDFQARRLGIRYKAPGQKGTRFVHTLNGTAVAVHAGAWWPSWRTTSRPTGRSSSRRCCGRGSARTGSSRRRSRERRRAFGRGARGNASNIPTRRTPSLAGARGYAFPPGGFPVEIA